MKTRVRELMHERGLTATHLAATMGETIGMMNTALSRGISSLSGIERFAHGLRVPVWEMLHAAPVAATGHELPEWQSELTGGVTLRLEELMQERHLTQTQLAERMGANRPNVNRWLRSRNLTLPTLGLFARALDIEDRLYLLFITQEEYDAELIRRGYVDPIRQEPKESVLDHDLFTQMEQEVHDKVLCDGVYNYRGRQIVLREGEICIC